MRNAGAVWAVSAAGAMLLVACAEAPVAPAPTRDVLPTYGWCHPDLMTRAARVPSPVNGVSLNTGGTLPGVMVTANYSGASFGIPFNLIQTMNFGAGTNLGPVQCGGAVGESYVVVDATFEPEPLPVPDGVDPNFWRELSPREQRTLLKWAEAVMRQFPGSYRSVGAVITERFGTQIQTVKTTAKIRALDFLTNPTASELLAGGIYGCMLYRRYSRDPWSLFSNAEVLELASSLTAAFGEAQFARRPLIGLRFGRNGAFGAGLAAADAQNTDCGWLVFRSVGTAILVTDPYDGSGGQPGGGDGAER
jgi:hypothetical protein